MALPHSASVKELGLSSRAFTVLDSAGIKTIGQLSAKSDSQLLQIRNIGRTILDQIREKLTLAPSMGTVSRWTMEEHLRQGRAYDLIARAEEHIRLFIKRNLRMSRIPQAILKKVIARSG